MKPAIDVIGEDKCTGCFGCYSSCPFDAIDIKLDKNGFYLPNIDRTKCTDCGICQNHCPVILRENHNQKEPEIYAARSNNFDLLMRSSSGGIFGELAKCMINNGGVVFGAGWDDNFRLVHKKIESIEEISLIQGSKYIQSDIGKTYNDVLSLAKKGRQILFCGTPCQVAALNTFLGKHPDMEDKIVTCDVVCHGVGSTTVFDKYLEHLKNRYKDEIKSISFRSKKNGWSDYSMKIQFSGGKRYIKSHKMDPFMFGYVKKIYLRKSCYNCPFSNISRQSDITLGDLWGAAKGMYNHWGVSVVLVNNDIGNKTIQKLIDSGQIKIKPYLIDSAIRSNPRIATGELQIPPLREDFLSDLGTKSFDEIMNMYLKKNITTGYILFKIKQYYKRIIWNGF